MPTPDSWIDTGRVADLVRQLLPEAEKKAQQIVNPSAPPAPLMPPSSETESIELPPEWKLAQPQYWSGEAFPDPVPQVPPEPFLAAPPAPSRRRDNPPESHQAPQPPTQDAENEATATMLEKASLSLASIRQMATGFLKSADNPPQPAPAPSPREAFPSPPTERIAGTLPERACFLPTTSIPQRVAVWAKWVREVTECTRLDVCDEHGHSLLPPEQADESGDSAAFVSSGLHLLQAVQSVREKLPRSEEGIRQSIYIPLSAGEWMGVLESPGPEGALCIALVAPGPLNADATAELLRTFRQAVDPATA